MGCGAIGVDMAVSSSEENEGKLRMCRNGEGRLFWSIIEWMPVRESCLCGMLDLTLGGYSIDAIVGQDGLRHGSRRLGKDKSLKLKGKWFKKEDAEKFKAGAAVS